jgi:hypothetical protein
MSVAGFPPRRIASPCLTGFCSASTPPGAPMHGMCGDTPPRTPNFIAADQVRIPDTPRR